MRSIHPLSDTFGRFHSYLRMSLIEKCNLRCQYCMPPEGVNLTKKSKLLTLQERKLVLELFYELGVSKFRFTGGEPTLSNQLIELISTVRNFLSRSSSLSPLTNKKVTIGMTTNGTLLNASYLRDLKDAGLDSINISLDTLDPTKFAAITRRDSKRLHNVLSSIYTSLSLGLKVKVNCVLMKGTNEDELPAFVQLSRELPLDVRFIELMPFAGNDWSRGKFISYSDALLTLQGAGYDMQPYSFNSSNQKQSEGSVEDDKGTISTATSSSDTHDMHDVHDTTKWYSNTGHGGRVGFITSMTNDFCTNCNRLRVTADGRLKVCLFGDESLSLRDHIRQLPSMIKSQQNEVTDPSQVVDTASSTITSSLSLREQLTSTEIDNLRVSIGTAVFLKEAKFGGRESPEDLAHNTYRPMILIGG